MEKCLDLIDVSFHDEDLMVMSLVLTSKHRHTINNWYSTRYKVLDELIQRGAPPPVLHLLNSFS